MESLVETINSYLFNTNDIVLSSSLQASSFVHGEAKAPASLVVGAPCVIHGLTGRSDLNGKSGIVSSEPDPTSLRLNVAGVIIDGNIS